MASPIELLEQGIITRNWEHICGAYQSLTGKSLLPPGQSENTNQWLGIEELQIIADHINEAQKMVARFADKGTVDVPVSKKLAKKKTSTKKNSKTPVDVSEYLKSEIEADVVEESDQAFFVAKSKDGGPIMPFNQISSPEMAELNQRSHKQNTRTQLTRQPYQPKMVNCTKCSVQFDFNKEYAGGYMSNQRRILCNKCAGCASG